MVLETNKSINRHSSVTLFPKPPHALFDLLKHQQEICMSVYLKTNRYHPENAVDPIAFKGLVKELEISLKDKCNTLEIKSLLEPFYQLQNDINFWDHTLDSLAIFRTADYFKVFKLQRDVPNVAIVSDSFHIKPLLRIFQTTDRYEVLALSSRGLKLFEGNRDVLDEIPLIDVIGKNTLSVLEEMIRLDEIENSDRFFREIDKSILETVSRVSGLPLFLVALPKNQSRFRSISRNPFLINEGVNLNADLMSKDELCKIVWKLARPYYDARMEELIEVYGEAQSRELGSDNISNVVKAAVEGKVETLLLEADRIIPGFINYKTASYEHGDLTNPEVDDLLDDIGECLLSKGGNIVMTPSHLMPTDKGIAAIYRY